MSCSGTVISNCNVNVLPCPGLQTMFVFSNTVDTKDGVCDSKCRRPLDN